MRDGHSAVLVIRGESGSGKTSLLTHLEGQSSGFRMLRATGVQSEMELAFAGLHQLCAQLLQHADRVPAPQRTALQSAFGLVRGDAPERFLVGLGALSLLASAAEEQPLLCLIDDAQWIDSASRETLTFVARRLLAEPVALVFAVRGPSDGQEPTGLPEMMLGPLDDQEARLLLSSAIPGRLDSQVRDRIIAEAHGNPLALLEFSRARSGADLAGGFDMLPEATESDLYPDATTVHGRIESSYRRRLAMLPRETQQLLLLAAADPVGDVTTLWRAAKGIGLGTESAFPAEVAEYAEIGAQVRFVHPLVRSAIYRGASPSDRRTAHRALADVTDPDIDPDRRAWHRARAATGPDETLANDLELSAERAQSRGGVAAAAAFLVRAAELTPDPGRRSMRALMAANAKFAAGAPDSAQELLTLAEVGPLGTSQLIRLTMLRAQLAFALRRGADAPPLLLDAATRLAPLDPALSRETYVEAFGAAIYVGRLDGGHACMEVAEAARRAPPAPGPPRPMDLLLDALVVRFTEGVAAAFPLFHVAVRAFHEARTSRGNFGRGSWLACRVAVAVWDDDSWHQLTSLEVGHAREVGALSQLPLANTYRAGVHVHAGEFVAAQSLIEEAKTINEAIGSAPLMYTALVLAAWRGQETEVLEMTRAALPNAIDRGEGRFIGLAAYATAVLYNGLGRYSEALVAAQSGCEFDDPGLFGWSLTELVEAATRSGQPEAAVTALQQLRERTNASQTDWALGIEARSAALLSDGQDAETKYAEALDRLSRTRIRVQLARTHLLYGEWLRRENRRTAARDQLRRAHGMFSEMGAEAFAGRTERELRAIGDTPAARSDSPSNALTPQEMQIAQMARTGQTNPEIGAQLFISPRTVEWHLSKTYAKLNIRSRRELRRSLPHIEHATKA